MSIDREQLARNFSRLSDEALKDTATRDLVPEAQALLQAELESRRLEREEARRIATERARENAARKAKGQHELDAEGRAMLAPIWAANMAQGWCKSSTWVLGIPAVLMLMAPPHVVGMLLIGVAFFARHVRNGLRKNSKTAALQFLLLVPVSALVVMLGAATLGSAMDEASVVPSLRGLGGLLWGLVVLVHYLAGFIECIGILLALRKGLFLDDEALAALNDVATPYDA